MAEERETVTTAKCVRQVTVVNPSRDVSVNRSRRVDTVISSAKIVTTPRR